MINIKLKKIIPIPCYALEKCSLLWLYTEISCCQRKNKWSEGGDSSGKSEKAETPQERSDEEAWPRPRKASPVAECIVKHLF